MRRAAQGCSASGRSVATAWMVAGREEVASRLWCEAAAARSTRGMQLLHVLLAGLGSSEENKCVPAAGGNCVLCRLCVLQRDGCRALCIVCILHSLHCCGCALWLCCDW